MRLPKAPDLQPVNAVQHRIDFLKDTEACRGRRPGTIHQKIKYFGYIGKNIVFNAPGDVLEFVDMPRNQIDPLC